MVQTLRTAAAEDGNIHPPTVGPRETEGDHRSALCPTAVGKETGVAAFRPRGLCSSPQATLTSDSAGRRQRRVTCAAHRVARATGKGANLQWAQTCVVCDTSAPARRHRVTWHAGAAARVAPGPKRSSPPPPTWPESHHAEWHAPRRGAGRSPVAKPACGSSAPASQRQQTAADNAAAARAPATPVAPGCHGRCVAAAGSRVCAAALTRPPRAVPPWRRAAPPTRHPAHAHARHCTGRGGVHTRAALHRSAATRSRGPKRWAHGCGALHTRGRQHSPRLRGGAAPAAGWESDNRRPARRGEWVGGPDARACRGSSSPLSHLPTPSSARKAKAGRLRSEWPCSLYRAPRTSGVGDEVGPRSRRRTGAPARKAPRLAEARAASARLFAALSHLDRADLTGQLPVDAPTRRSEQCGSGFHSTTRVSTRPQLTPD